MRRIPKYVQIIFYCLLACAIGCTNTKYSFQKLDFPADTIKTEPTVNEDWRETKKTNVVEGYEMFLKKYPNSIYESEARRIIEELRWKEVRSLDTIAAYQSYIQKYPGSKYAFQGTLRLRALQEDLSKWETAQEKNSIKSYTEFLKENPNSAYSNKAKAKIVDLEVADIMQKPHGTLPPPEKITNEEGRSFALVNIFNDTKYTLTIRYSGPDSFKINFSPAEEKTVKVLNGKYRMTASANASNVRSFAGEEVLDGGNYKETFYIVTYSSTINPYQPDSSTKPVESLPFQTTTPDNQPENNTGPTQQWPIMRTIPENQPEGQTEPIKQGPIRRTIPDNLQ